MKWWTYVCTTKQSWMNWLQTNKSAAVTVYVFMSIILPHTFACKKAKYNGVDLSLDVRSKDKEFSLCSVTTMKISV